MTQDSLILAAESGRLPVNALDYLILAIYFLVVVGIGVMARRAISTSECGCGRCTSAGRRRPSGPG